MPLSPPVPVGASLLLRKFQALALRKLDSALWANQAPGLITC